MRSLIRISDAAVIAVHAAILLAEAGGKPVPTSVIAYTFSVSPAHVSKVMQRLEKAGLVKSARGPSGGFTLSAPPSKIKLRRMVETMDGKIETCGCLLGRDACMRKRCMLGDFLARTGQGLIEVLDRSVQEAAAYTHGKN
jgi:Rrf2 family protein